MVQVTFFKRNKIVLKQALRQYSHLISIKSLPPQISGTKRFPRDLAPAPPVAEGKGARSVLILFMVAVVYADAESQHEVSRSLKMKKATAFHGDQQQTWARGRRGVWRHPHCGAGGSLRQGVLGILRYFGASPAPPPQDAGGALPDPSSDNQTMCSDIVKSPQCCRPWLSSVSSVALALVRARLAVRTGLCLDRPAGRCRSPRRPRTPGPHRCCPALCPASP